MSLCRKYRPTRLWPGQLWFSYVRIFPEHFFSIYFRGHHLRYKCGQVLKNIFRPRKLAQQSRTECSRLMTPERFLWVVDCIEHLLPYHVIWCSKPKKDPIVFSPHFTPIFYSISYFFVLSREGRLWPSFQLEISSKLFKNLFNENNPYIPSAFLDFFSR